MGLFYRHHFGDENSIIANFIKNGETSGDVEAVNLNTFAEVQEFFIPTFAGIRVFCQELYF